MHGEDAFAVIRPPDVFEKWQQLMKTQVQVKTNKRKWLGLCYVTPIKRIREQRVSAHLLIYSFLFITLTLRFGLDFEFGLRLT